VRDTTGAGDSFAGAFIGYLDRRGDTSLHDLKAAVVFGSVVASFAVEDFSVTGLLRANESSMADRYAALASMTRIEMPETRPVFIQTQTLIKEGV